MFQVTRERMTKELTALVPSTMKVKAVVPPLSEYSIWTFKFSEDVDFEGRVR